MEIYKHKKSEKHFIFVKHDRINFAYFVNHRARLLKLGLFDFEEYPLDNSPEYFLRHKLVTNEQIKCYKQYLEFRAQDEVAREKARYDSIYGEWTDNEIENYINILKKELSYKKERKISGAEAEKSKNKSRYSQGRNSLV